MQPFSSSLYPTKWLYYSRTLVVKMFDVGGSEKKTLFIINLNYSLVMLLKFLQLYCIFEKMNQLYETCINIYVFEIKHSNS